MRSASSCEPAPALLQSPTCPSSPESDRVLAEEEPARSSQYRPRPCRRTSSLQFSVAPGCVPAPGGRLLPSHCATPFHSRVVDSTTCPNTPGLQESDLPPATSSTRTCRNRHK